MLTTEATNELQRKNHLFSLSKLFFWKELNRLKHFCFVIPTYLYFKAWTSLFSVTKSTIWLRNKLYKKDKFMQNNLKKAKRKNIEIEKLHRFDCLTKSNKGNITELKVSQKRKGRSEVNIFFYVLLFYFHMEKWLRAFSGLKRKIFKTIVITQM